MPKHSTSRTFRRRLLGEQLEMRAMFHAEAAWDNAAALTLSFVPDGTHVGQQLSALPAAFQSFGEANWHDAVYRAFQTWAQYANINIGVVSDAGDPLGSSQNDITGPRFGDIRIAAVPMSADTLAVSIPHDAGVAGSWSGDFLFNSLGNFSSLDDVFKVALHEAGHVLGMDHSVDPLSPMFRHSTNITTLPTAGDVAVLQNLYGPRSADRNEPQVANDTIDKATRLGLSESSGYTGATPAIEFGAISTASDADYFELQNLTGYSGPITFQVTTSGLSLLAPKLTIYDRKGNVIGQATGSGHVGSTLTFTIPTATDSKYYARVEAAPNSGTFGLGGYAIVGSFVNGQTATPAQVDRVVQQSFRLVGLDETAITDLDIAQFFASSELQELNDDLHADDNLVSAAKLDPQVNSAAMLRYQTVASLADATDHDFYTIMSAENNGPQWLTVSVQSLVRNGLIASVVVRDRHGDVVPAEIRASGAGDYVVELAGIESGRQYILDVSSPSTSAAYQSGNYKLTATFHFASAPANQFASGVLTASASLAEQPLYVAQSQLFSFLLNTQSSANAGVAWMAIFDVQGRVMYSLTTNVGQARSASSVLLQPGEYTIQFGADEIALASGEVNYSLTGEKVSQPVGPPLIDPAAAPVYSCNGTPNAYCYPTGTSTAQSYEIGAATPKIPLVFTPIQRQPDAGFWSSNTASSNPIRPQDSNGDGLVTPLDALLIINDLNALGPRPVPAPPRTLTNFLDVNNDGVISPLDALLVINFLNNRPGGEGEAPAIAPAANDAGIADAALLLLLDDLLAADSRTAKPRPGL
jgi:hypothetical protein